MKNNRGSHQCPTGCRCGKHDRGGDAQLAITLYQQGESSVDQILSLAGMSRSALYRKLKAAGIRPDLGDRTPRSGKTDARHMRLFRARGPARLQFCVRHLESGVSTPARDWARIHTEDGMDIWADYVPLCRSCHIRYDSDARAYTHELRAMRSSQMSRRWADGTGPRRTSLPRNPATGRFVSG